MAPDEVDMHFYSQVECIRPARLICLLLAGRMHSTCEVDNVEYSTCEVDMPFTRRSNAFDLRG
jgi:hypothetical protein